MSLLRVYKQIGLVQSTFKLKPTHYFYCCVLRKTTYSTTIENKEKNKLLTKWLRYWEDLIKDYNDVLKETLENAKKYPRKTFLLSSFFGLILLCMETNPDDLDYKEYVITCSNDVSLVASAVRNPETDQFLRTIESCYNLGLMRRLNLGVISVLWIDNYSNELGLFKSNCSYIKPQYLSIYNRVVDIGFFGKWWRLHKSMQDYDVNFKDWVGDKNTV